MKKYSLQITLFSILVIRIIVFLLGLTSFATTMYEDAWHHYYLGLILLLLSFIKSTKFSENTRIALFSVGVGLVVDEVILPLYLLNVWNWGYWDYRTLISVVVATLAYVLLYLKYMKSKNRN